MLECWRSTTVLICAYLQLDGRTFATFTSFGGNAVAVHAKASTLPCECSVSVSADYQARAEATLVSDTVVWKAGLHSRGLKNWAFIWGFVKLDGF